METHSSAMVATGATAATSVAEIEKFLSRRQRQQQRRCILLMETTLNFSSDGGDKNASQSAFHTMKTSGSATRHISHILANYVQWRSECCFLHGRSAKIRLHLQRYRKSYKDKCIKMNCWAKMGEKFDMSAADAEKKI